ncbi:MAG: cation diffusion facilitator family transporter [Candidatus Saccharibacteria bacterium]|nr:cation diffusion facilitator family transporter [Candidatus Saccharibacteria bacterium]
MKNHREKVIIRTSIISIVSNLVLVGFKTTIGLISNSIAIISDAVNNLSDALSGIITIIGTKLANKAPDRNHPHGHGRIEYITSLLVSAIVLYAGLTALIESVNKIIHPEPVDYSPVTIIILSAGIIVKFALGIYVKKKGKIVNSDSLVASGTDALNDAILSTSVLISAIIYLVFSISLEAYVGAMISIFIIKAGIDLVKESVDNMLGTRVEGNLAQKIKREIIKEKDVHGAFDLDLHDYGPDRYLGSVHIELPDTLSVVDVDRISRRITKNILDKYGVLLHTIGVYSANTQDKNIMKIKSDITKIVFSHDGILEMHGFYLDKAENTITFDIIIDFKKPNREEIYQDILSQIQDKFPKYKINITLDVDVSD